MAKNRHTPNLPDRTTGIPTSDGAVRELEKEALAARHNVPAASPDRVVSLGKAGDGAPEESRAAPDLSEDDACSTQAEIRTG